MDLPAEQVEGLDQLCRQEGISRAEAVRRAVAEQLRTSLPADSSRAFGLWRDRKIDGLAYERKIRREWVR